MSSTTDGRTGTFDPRPAVGAIQRARIVEAMVLVVSERGYAGASIGSVTARAKVSRRAFHEAFYSLEECFLAVLDEGAARTSALMSEAFAAQENWLDGVRGALAALLSFFDGEPVLARVLLVEATAAGAWARERRERHIASLTALIEARWGAPQDGHMYPLVTAGVMAALLGVLHTHLVTAREGPLITLLGPLMGLVTAPYLERRLVVREIERGEAMGHRLCKQRHSQPTQAVRHPELPALLLDPRAHRARACLLYLASNPGVSNREVADAVGVSGRTQMSALLARLACDGLLVKCAGAPGAPNAWSLSDYGVRVARVLARAVGGSGASPTNRDRQPSSARSTDTCTVNISAAPRDACVTS